MRHAFVQLVSVLAASSGVFGQARVVITEIMYNPASNEKNGEAEWVEIANLGNQPIEMKDWRLDDEDKKNWGKFSCTLAPGGVAVIINDKVKEAEFREAWDQPAELSASAVPTYQVIPVKWSGLANDPDEKNEVLQLLNDKDEVVCEVKQAGEWPKCNKPDGPSICLADLAAANISDGKLWRKSEAGKDGARNNRKTALFDKEDCGSPGFVNGLSAGGSAPPPAAAPAATKPAATKPADKDKIDY